MNSLTKRTLSLCISGALLLAALTGCNAQKTPETTPSPESPTTETSSPEVALNLKDDFYEAINHEWISNAEIPSDMPTINGFTNLSDDIEAKLIADFNAMRDGEKEIPSEVMQNFIELYRMATDLETRNSLGATPVLPYLQKVADLDSFATFVSQLDTLNANAIMLPFSFSVSADMGDAQQNAVHAFGSGLFLPDKSYYEDAQMSETLLDAFSQMMVNLLVLAGETQEDAEKITADAIAFDALLVPTAKSAEEMSDYTSLYNPMTLEEFAALSQNIDFTTLVQTIFQGSPDKIIVANPDFFKAIDTIINAENFELMKNWMYAGTLMSCAPYLSEEFRLESSSFARMLQGTAEASAPEISAFYQAASLFSEPIGVYYGKTYFGEDAKNDVSEMVHTIIQVYATRLENNDWLSDETKATAIDKLNNMAVHIGYPDEMDSVYATLEPTPAAEGGNYFENVMKLSLLVYQNVYAQWNQPTDREKWPLSADTVNAMYSPTSNSINFPAAILQAPFYSLEQTTSENYGGIGAVIAHEISHAFDPNGAKFDAYGSLSNWWTDDDYTEFETRSKAMKSQFDGLPHAGGTVNGTLTLAENIADLGGLSCALEAVQSHADVNLEEFFTNWAVIWRAKSTPEYDSLLLASDVHAPNKLRANVQLQNFEEFHEAFGIQKGDGMYLAPENRVQIW